MILVIAASAMLAAARQPDTSSVWTRIPGGPGTGCAHDSSYAFFVHPGDDRRLVIFLNGGGACWNGLNCDLHARPTYHPELDSTNTPDQHNGIFDLSNSRNPIRGYTVVFIPYCTADLFLGGRTVSYTSADTTGASRTFEVRHRGRANADRAVAWVYAHYPVPRLVFVVGSSAGAIPSPFYASQVARHYPHARIVQLGDGAGGYRAPPIPGILAQWGATTLLRSDPAYRGVDSAALTFETLYEVAARTTPQVTFAQYNSAEDNVQLSFLALLGVRDVSLASLLATNLAEIRRTNPALHTYTAPGPMHTILRRPEFYRLTVDGVAVRDWVADLLNGKRVDNVGQSLLAQHFHRLPATPQTVAWGYYSAAATPVLRIASGDTIDVETMITNLPNRLEAAGVAPGDVQQSLRDIVAQDSSDRGPGGHILTGPVYVEGADSGDVLEVRILSIDLAIPYGYNGCYGFLPANCDSTQRTRIIPLDPTHMVAHYAPGLDLPLHPFFGSMGVAPPRDSGRVSSNPPGIHAGNMDNRELVAGTTLFIPIHAAGALFEVGDGHVAQGDGEVDQTAIETSLRGRLQLIVRKDLRLTWPRAETPTYYITMGMDKDLTRATQIAVQQAIDFLAEARGWSKMEAYRLVSVACDVRVTELVDGNVGVHVMIPKTIVGAAH